MISPRNSGQKRRVNGDSRQEWEIRSELERLDAFAKRAGASSAVLLDQDKRRRLEEIRARIDELRRRLRLDRAAGR